MHIHNHIARIDCRLVDDTKPCEPPHSIPSPSTDYDHHSVCLWIRWEQTFDCHMDVLYLDHNPKCQSPYWLEYSDYLHTDWGMRRSGWLRPHNLQAPPLERLLVYRRPHSPWTIWMICIGVADEYISVWWDLPDRFSHMRQRHAGRRSACIRPSILLLHACNSNSTIPIFDPQLAFWIVRQDTKFEFSSW